MSSACVRWPVRVCAVGALFLALAPTSLGDAEPTVAFHDTGEEHGDLSVGAHRIRITRDGHPTVVYFVKMRVAPGQQLRVRADLQVTRCRDTDYNPPAGKTSGCEHTHVYDYAPHVKMKFFLAKPQPDAPGTPRVDGEKIGDTIELTCTEKKHHCVPVNIESQGVESIDPTIPDGGADRFVTVVVEASNDQAKSCNAGDPSTCDVMDLEEAHGRLNVLKVTQPVQALAESATWDDTSEDADRLHVITNPDTQENLQRVVYSVKINPAGDVGSTLGDIIEVRGNLLTHSGLPYPTPPLVASYLVLANAPDKLDGRKISQRNGENCDGDCGYVKQADAAITCEDVRTGKRFVNLVARAERTTDYASTNDTVNIRAGGELNVRRFDSRVNPDAPANC
jgi:hypothetical protein